MYISHKYKFIFIHIPKNAGSSIISALFPFFSMPSESEQGKGGVGKAAEYIHGNVHDGVNNDKTCLIERYPDYFSFAFVRNPWDRAFGYYHFHKKHFPRYTRDRSFFEYMQLAEKKKTVKFIYTNQAFWIMKKNKLMIDYVGRYETLYKNFIEICERIGLPPNIELGHVNKNPIKPNGDYRQYYGKKLRDLVGRIFERDIKLFNYSF